MEKQLVMPKLQPEMKSGKDGESLVVRVPVGTIVRDLATDTVIADMNEAGKRRPFSFTLHTTTSPTPPRRSLPPEIRKVSTPVFAISMPSRKRIGFFSSQSSLPYTWMGQHEPSPLSPASGTG